MGPKGVTTGAEFRPGPGAAAMTADQWAAAVGRREAAHFTLSPRDVVALCGAPPGPPCPACAALAAEVAELRARLARPDYAQRPERQP